MQPPWHVGTSDPHIGPSMLSSEEGMRETPDGTPYVPPSNYPEELQSLADPSVTTGSALLAVLFTAISLIVLLVFASRSEPGSLVCLPLLVLLAIVAIAGLRLMFGGEPTLFPDPPVQEPVHEVVRVETIYETVKVRCRYCGTLNLVTDTNCKACGGNL